MKKLYIFDFDGTLTQKDSLFDFLKFANPKTYTFGFLLFSPFFALGKLGILETGKVKEKFISYFFKGKTQQELETIGNKYCQTRIPSLLHSKALIYLESIRNEPNKYLVTASLDIWAKPFANYFGLNFIGTMAEYDNTIFTGKFATQNCNYQEKVKRIQSTLSLTEYSQILIFGDTSGDKPMLELATHPHFKFFE